MRRIPSITAFFPACNDGGTIPSMVLTALLTLRLVSDDYEIVVSQFFNWRRLLCTGRHLGILWWKLMIRGD